MSFWDKIDAIHDYSERGDIRYRVAYAHFFDFAGFPIRVWPGQGRMFASDGQVFIGTVDATGRDHLQVPAHIDGRDGSSPILEFTLPFVDEETFFALRDERWRVKNRQIIRYLVLFDHNEGLRPATPLTFDTRFWMLSVKTEQGAEFAGSTTRRVFSATVTAKNGNIGRSKARRGTWSPTGQRDRARELYGIENDRGCDFVPELANKTFQKP